MNFNQGMQRLAIFAGMMGAVAGGFYAHKQLRHVPSDRYQHKVYQRLSGSDIVQRERALLKSASENGHTSEWPLATSIDYYAIAAKYGGVVSPPEVLPKDFTDWDKPVATSGIKTVYWNPDYSVDFFEMQDGGLVIGGSPPSAWLYLLWAVFPALGFVVLWGLVHGIRWVGAGFSQVAK